MENETKLFIKGMVCNRCVMVVKEELKDLGVSGAQVELGVVKVDRAAEVDKTALEKRLAHFGFRLLHDPKSEMVKKVKALVREVYSGEYDFAANFRFAALVKERLGKEYETVSDVFIAWEQQTIEQYMIAFRMNKVKEYLVYSDSTLADIAFRLNFSSVAHLSSQFKKHTGLTPSFFKEIRRKKPDVISAGS